MFKITQELGNAYPGSHIGILVIENVLNLSNNPDLEKIKQSIEKTLRDQFKEQDPHMIETISPYLEYRDYYKKFNKTYHVQGQLISVVYKEKSIPSIASLVEVMFMAEMKNGLLTAGHDLDKLQLPITLGLATGNEKYILMNGQEQTTKANDRMISDQNGIISSIIYGPDARTQITSATRNVLYTVYTPAGIAPLVIQQHLEDIRNYVLITSPDANIKKLQIIDTDLM